MPFSNQFRRKKPRISYENEKSNIPNEQKPSKIEQKNLKNPYNNNEKNDEKKITDDELQKIMWNQVQVSKENPIKAPLITSEFAVKYPSKREGYLRMSEIKIKNFFNEYGIKFEIDFKEQTLNVFTTKKTWDPYSIIKARDFIRLLSRFVPFEHAGKVMNDNIFSDIIEMRKSKVGKKKIVLIKRRARLVGPNGVTLKAIELLTKCYILVYGYTISIIGDFKGIKKVRKIVFDCLNNIHPIYGLKRLMAENELSKNETLKNENWDKLLPKFKKIKKDNTSLNNSFTNKLNKNLTLLKIKKLKKKKKKKKYTPWPNDITPSKIDIALQTGQYWDNNWRKENLLKKTNEQKINIINNEKQNKLNKKIKNKKFEKKINKKKRFNNMINPDINMEDNAGKLNKFRLNNKKIGNSNGKMNVDKFKKKVNVMRKERSGKRNSNEQVKEWFLEK